MIDEATLEQRIADNCRAFATYTLTTHGAPPVRLYQLRKPGLARVQGVDIVITGGGTEDVAERILITGDLAPNRNDGSISVVGYGLDWFAGRCPVDYLCSRFLRKQWVPADARAALRERLVEEQEEVQDAGEAQEDASRAVKKVEKLTAALDEVGRYSGGVSDPTRSAEAFSELWVEVYGDTPESIGYGYDARDAALLIVIQDTFRHLYWEAVDVAERAARDPAVTLPA